MCRISRLRSADQGFSSGLMDSKVTVFLIVMLLAVLRGLMQRSQVRKEIEDREARGSVSFKRRSLNRRKGPAVESESANDVELPRDEIECRLENGKNKQVRRLTFGQRVATSQSR